MPQPWPNSSMRRQSASFWFQWAALESVRHPGRSASPSGCSILSIPRFEVGRLAEARLAARDPVGHPIDHRLERHARLAEQHPRRARVDQPRALRLFAEEGGATRKASAEFLGKAAHAHFRAAEVDRRGGRGAVREKPQRLLVGITLPDDVCVAHVEGHGLALEYLERHVIKHAVAHVDRIRKTYQAARRAVAARAMAEHLLAPHTGSGVIPR